MKYVALIFCVGLLAACGGSNNTASMSPPEMETPEEENEEETEGETETGGDTDTETADTDTGDTDTTDTDTQTTEMENCGFWCEQPALTTIIKTAFTGHGYDASLPRFQLMNRQPTIAGTATYAGSITMTRETEGNLYSAPAIELTADFTQATPTIRGSVTAQFDQDDNHSRVLTGEWSDLADNGTFDTRQDSDDHTGITGAFYGVYDASDPQNIVNDHGIVGFVNTQWFGGNYLTQNTGITPPQ